MALYRNSNNPVLVLSVEEIEVNGNSLKKVVCANGVSCILSDSEYKDQIFEVQEKEEVKVEKEAEKAKPEEKPAKKKKKATKTKK